MYWCIEKTFFDYQIEKSFVSMTSLSLINNTQLLFVFSHGSVANWSVIWQYFYWSIYECLKIIWRKYRKFCKVKLESFADFLLYFQMHCKQEPHNLKPVLANWNVKCGGKTVRWETEKFNAKENHYRVTNLAVSTVNYFRLCSVDVHLTVFLLHCVGRGDGSFIWWCSMLPIHPYIRPYIHIHPYNHLFVNFLIFVNLSWIEFQSLIRGGSLGHTLDSCFNHLSSHRCVGFLSVWLTLLQGPLTTIHSSIQAWGCSSVVSVLSWARN